MVAEAVSEAKSPAAVRKPTRSPNGRKTANRFRKFAGGEDSADYLAAAQRMEVIRESGAAGAPGGGTPEGLASIGAADGHKIVQVAVDVIAPHPYNDRRRSQPQPGNPRWDELVNSVRAAGVQIPALLV